VKRLAGALLVALALSGSGSAGTLRSGIYGQVTRGPLRPVCYVDQPCDGPAANVTLVVTRAGREVARTRTTKTGSYRVRLVPGRYVVRLPTRPPIGGMSPRGAHVTRGHFVRLDLSIDTGIR
jgi:hypothetical protein